MVVVIYFMQSYGIMAYSGLILVSVKSPTSIVLQKQFAWKVSIKSYKISLIFSTNPDRIEKYLLIFFSSMCLV